MPSGRPIYEPNPATTAARHGYDIERLKRRRPPAADWVYIGSGAPAPDFQNGWSNSGGPKVPMRYRLLPVADTPSGQAGIEIQGSVTGGTPGSVIFSLPVTIDYDVHLSAADDTGAFTCITVKQSGDVVDGFA